MRKGSRSAAEGTLSRRALLRGLGASALLSPWLPLLNVSGQEATPRRLILFFTPHGTVWNQFRPSGTESDFKLSRILLPLQELQKKIVVLDGVGMRADGPGAAHTKGPALLFTASPLRNDGVFTRGDCSGGCTFGWNSGPSFDQVLAKKLAGATPYKSLEFGVRSGGGFPGAHTIYAAPSTPVPPRQDPVATFNELFSAVPSNGTDETARKRRHRETVLRLLGGELTQLEGRVSRLDRPKVQAHREALNDLSAQLFRPVPSCEMPAKPNAAEQASDVADSMRWILNRNIELLVGSMRCDLTRIASLQLRLGENDGYPYRWLGIDGEHHAVSHDSSPAAQEQLAKIYTYYADRFAYMLKLLDAIPEGEGTMLDHTLVIWGSEVGTGFNHDFSNMPFVIAGGGAYGVRGGRYLKLPAGTYHNRLIVSAMRFMGSDVDSFGSTDQERGPLPGLGV